MKLLTCYSATAFLLLPRFEISSSFSRALLLSNFVESQELLHGSGW
jgi:hypothetical protein